MGGRKTGGARPTGRARIETLAYFLGQADPDLVAPGLPAGRGLKLCPLSHGFRSTYGGARPTGRARIETLSPTFPAPAGCWWRPAYRPGED